MSINANKWMTLLAMAFIFFAGLVISVVFFIDPFLFYRNISNDKKLMEPRYTSIGIVKNYTHDMTILGMDSYNYMDMLYIRNYHERRPIQLGIENSNLNEVLMLYTMAQTNSNSDFYFINMNTEEFLADSVLDLSSNKFPDYLYNKSKLDDIKYLLNYEICFRYIPLNTIIDISFKLNKSLPVAMQEGTEIDKVVKWKQDRKPVRNLAKGINTVFRMEGKENSLSVLEQENRDTRQIVESRIDNYLDIIFKQLDSKQTLVFGFMPYSIEYWAKVSKMDLDTILYAKEYFIKECVKKTNVKIVDLQEIAEINIPTNYTTNLSLSEDLIKLYTDAVFDNTIYEGSKLFDKSKSSLEKQIQVFLKNN